MSELEKEIHGILNTAPLCISSTRRFGENGLRNADEVTAKLMPIIQAQLTAKDRVIKACQEELFIMIDLIEGALRHGCTTTYENLTHNFIKEYRDIFKWLGYPNDVVLSSDTITRTFNAKKLIITSIAEIGNNTNNNERN